MWWETFVLRLSNVPELLHNARINWQRNPQLHDGLTDFDSSAFAGQVAVVTGANAGIGLDLSTALALRGAHVIMACRSAEKSHAAVSSVTEALRLQQCSPKQRMRLAHGGPHCVVRSG